MNLQRLYSFTVVADTRSYVKAAELLHFSQPALSKQINTLEHELGVKLLERNTHGVSLTEAGKVLLDGAGRVFNAVSELEEDVLRAGKREGAKLNIGMEVFHLGSMHNFNRAFTARYPAAEVNVNAFLGSDTVKTVLCGDMDVGLIRSFEVPVGLCGGQLDYKYLIRAEFRACVQKDHPLAAKGKLRLADLKGYDFVCLRHILKDSGELQKQLCRQAGMNMLSEQPAKHEDMMYLLFDERNIGLYETAIVQPPGDEYRLLELEDFDLTFYVTAIWRADNENPLLHRYLKEIEEIVKL